MACIFTKVFPQSNYNTSDVSNAGKNEHFAQLFRTIYLLYCENTLIFGET